MRTYRYLCVQSSRIICFYISSFSFFFSFLRGREKRYKEKKKQQKVKRRDAPTRKLRKNPLTIVNDLLGNLKVPIIVPSCIIVKNITSG